MANNTQYTDSTPGSFPPAKTSRIAIMGAGVSGLTAARALKDRGYENVVVFEKEDRIGGKVYSYFHEGKAYELGAVWLSPDYRAFLDVYNRFKSRAEPYEKAAVTAVLSMTGVHQDYREYLLSEMSPLQMMRQLALFLLLVGRHRKLDQPGFTHAGPSIQLSFAEFVKQNKVESLARLAASFLTGCGYGYYGHVPAMYLMKFLPIVLKGITRFVTGVGTPMFYFPSGWQRFYEELATHLDVRLNHEISSIVRKIPADGHQITLRAAGEEHLFDYLLLTGNLKETAGFLDWSDDESDLLGKIRSQRYMVSLIQSKGLPHATVAEHADPEMVGHIAAIGHFRQSSDVYTIYQLLDEKMDEDQATYRLVQDIESIGAEVKRVITQKIWDYFPIVETQHLNGYYQRLEALQGTRGTFYLGGLMNFETVERNTEYAKHLIDRFFS